MGVNISGFGHHFVASWLFYCYAIYQGFRASTQEKEEKKKKSDWCRIQQWEWIYLFVSPSLFIQKLNKLKILLHILKALIAWNCDKAYAWITLSVTMTELSQGWSSAGGQVSSKKRSKRRVWKSLICKLWKSSVCFHFRWRTLLLEHIFHNSKARHISFA